MSAGATTRRCPMGRSTSRCRVDPVCKLEHEANHVGTIGDMRDLPFDAQERLALCDLFDELGADAPTLLDGWTARDLAAHIVLRERDPIAGPCLVLPGLFQRFAERRRARLAEHTEFGWLVARIRSGPPPGLFRIGWVRSVRKPERVFRPPRGRAQSQRPRPPRHPDAGLGGCLVAKRSPRWPLPESQAARSRARDRVGRNRPAGDGSEGRTHCATQRSAGRTAPIHLRAPGRGAG